MTEPLDANAKVRAFGALMTAPIRPTDEDQVRNSMQALSDADALAIALPAKQAIVNATDRVRSLCVSIENAVRHLEGYRRAYDIVREDVLRRLAVAPAPEPVIAEANVVVVRAMDLLNEK